MRAVRNLMKASYGRPFLWGNVQPLVKPECHHSLSCMVRKVKKEGLNKDRKFFCCPNDKESSCGYFDWVPEEPRQDVSFVEPNSSKPPEKHEEHYLTNKFINDFANSLNI
ncbi:endonuclease 8-like 3 [Paramuricea clavata]|uniref:Endonuclease 8-like 3 n=1 Tax=Paramuricea clavata TaxID=317549 RepID=A0A7D9IG50_PARCT|nr:endonuclease 8-like 3 [Paramuricea clavata]